MCIDRYQALWVLALAPGLKTGAALRNTETGELQRWTTDFWEAYQYALWNRLTLKYVVIEMPMKDDCCGIREANLLAEGLKSEGLHVIREESQKAQTISKCLRRASGRL